MPTIIWDVKPTRSILKYLSSRACVAQRMSNVTKPERRRTRRHREDTRWALPDSLEAKENVENQLPRPEVATDGFESGA